MNEHKFIIFQYIQAQQEVEEYKRQLDILDFDNKQVSDQIQIEIQKMKVDHCIFFKLLPIDLKIKHVCFNILLITSSRLSLGEL